MDSNPDKVRKDRLLIPLVGHRRRRPLFAVLSAAVLAGLASAAATYFYMARKQDRLESRLEESVTMAREARRRVFEVQDQYEPCAGAPLWAEIARIEEDLEKPGLDEETSLRLYEKRRELIWQVPNFAVPTGCPKPASPK
jgi:hypothetical protein